MHPARADAIHRALLTGLLGNIGVRADGYEYSGPRNLKFNLFPGSALFKRRPQWVMAAELVQTTKLYARTVGPIRPEWVERAAAHLVKREYWDPHWRKERARVEAWERVTLYGLVVVPRQPVHYGPIEPKLSRDIFILHALVRSEFRTDATFFRHNSDLVEQVLRLEAKARRRDVLADEQTRFRFFDSRVPQRIYNGHEFEKWRRQAEKANPRLLFMERRDVTLHDATGVTEELYPDQMVVGGTLRVPLEYRYEPDHPADGVTATVPLAALNGLPDEQFEWLAPGMLKEKAIALIRSLPKPLRVQLIPAPEVADEVVAGIRFGEGPMLDAVAFQLGKRAGAQIPRTAFDLAAMPEHLRMNFRIIDTTGKAVLMGRDLAAIRKKLGMKALDTFAALPPTPFHREQVVRWDFGDLPPHVEIPRHGLTLLGYPALVENPEGTVSLRLLDAEPHARAAHRAGLRRLFMLQLGQELKYILRKLPDPDRLALQYALIGNGEELKRDLAIAVADRAFFGDAEDTDAWDIRTHADFAVRAEAGWRRLAAAGEEVVAVVSESLSLFHDLSDQLDRDFPPMLLSAARDMRDQLARLVYPGFIARTPFHRLRHLPRYLKGIQNRLQKLQSAGLARDAQQSAVIAPLWRRFLEREQLHESRGVHDAAMERYRWLMEELRVSLFAQELRTPVTVSPKRLEALWGEVQE